MTAGRVVLVGHGHVGARFATAFVAEVPESVGTLTVVGYRPPVNTTLLPDLLAGRTTEAMLRLPGVSAAEAVLVEAPAVAIDRDRGLVIDAAGSAHPFDTLVLATGSAPVAVPGVRVLHTLADCRELVAELPRARTAAVLGASALGLEVASALRLRGLAVALIEPSTQVLPGVLDAESAKVAQTSLTDLGICVHLGHAAAPPGTDLVIDCSATATRVDLASSAGLAVADSGLVVGPDSRSVTDPRVAAIRDWAEAERLVRSLSGTAPRTASAAPGGVVRLRAPGMDVVAMGDWANTAGDGRVITLLDPQARRAVRLVVRLGRLIGATAVGAGQVAADLILAYRHATPVPSDPAQLVLKSVPVKRSADAVDGSWVPPVCRCNSVTAAQITDAFAGGAHDIGAIATATRATTGCGGCTDKVCRLIDSLRAAAVGA